MTFKYLKIFIFIFITPSLVNGQKLVSDEPSKFGWDESAINMIHERATQMDRLNSLLILRRDTLVYEKYYNKFTKEDYSNIKSASKSILNLLVGIAVEKQYIASIDETIFAYLPELFDDTSDLKKQEITIRHLMLMQSGLKPTSLSNYAPWVASEDWLQYAIDQPLEALPGELYGYSTGDTHLLAAVLSKASGMTALQFAEKYLYTPMGITIQEWSTDPKGNHEGGNNVYIKPIDLAKIGVMVRQGGLYNGEQIVSKDWISESTAYQVEPQGISRPFEINGYGYLWWLVKALKYDTYSAIGFGGQYMMTIPELDVIIVLTSQYKGSAPNSHFQSIADLIENHILKSLEL
ncbi:serine hydrolase domain-containing protein [Anditalea andensis]|nr:serine hydrolase [Anditalea andensis]